MSINEQGWDRQYGHETPLTDSYTQTFTLQVDCLDVSRPVCSLRCCGRRTCKEKAQHKYFIDISNLQDQDDITIQLSPSSYSDL